MPDTIDVTCPNCDKKLKVPAKFEGKKIKCKDCQEVILVNPAAKPKAPAKPAKPADKPAPPPEPAPKSPFLDDDEEDARKVEVIVEEDVARCPHCAKEMEPQDAVVCIHCGYNTRTREKAETKRVIAASQTDWMTHLAPGIIALLIAVGLIALDIYCAVHMREWMEGSFFEQEEKDLSGRKKMFVKPGAFSTLIIAVSIVIVVPAVRFAIRRLVFNYKPEEKVKK